VATWLRKAARHWLGLEGGRQAVPADIRTDFMLTDKEREALVETARTDGYKAILKVFGATCQGFTNSLLSTDPADERAVLTSHMIAQASWLLLDSFKKQVNVHQQAWLDGQQDIEQRLRELGRDDFVPAAATVEFKEPETPLQVMGIKGA